MTRLGRRTWWAVASAATTGLLLSLVLVTRGGDPVEVREVRGEAALFAPGPDSPVAMPGGRDERTDAEGA